MLAIVSAINCSYNYKGQSDKFSKEPPNWKEQSIVGQFAVSMHIPCVDNSFMLTNESVCWENFKKGKKIVVTDAKLEFNRFTWLKFNTISMIMVCVEQTRQSNLTLFN